MARGSVYRRRTITGVSRWNAVIDLPRGSDDRRRQVTRTFDTAGDAHAWLAQVAVDAGTAGIAGRGIGTLVSDYLTAWLDGQVFLRPSTRASYRAHLEKYLNPAIGGISLERLSVTDVERLTHNLSSKGLAAATVQRILATLRSAMAHAVRTGLIDKNPTTGVRVPSQVVRPIHTWTPDEAATFLDRLTDDALGVLLRLALVTGMRRGELLGLRWSHVSLTGGFLFVQVSRLSIGGVTVEGPPKSRAGTRTVFVDPATVNALRQLQLASRPEGEDGHKALVFTDADGRPFTPWWVSRQFQQVIADLGLPRIRFHDLRHTSATLGLASGESLKEVSARLGHSNIGITADVYADVLPETARASTLRRASLMAGSRSRFIMKRQVAS
jgi:integrase